MMLISSGSKLVGFEFKNRHVLIVNHDKLASTMWQIFVTEEQQKRNAGSGRWGWFISIMVA
jgi:nitric oxide synthase oxygenase domain/subunit